MITLKKLKWSNCFSYGPDNELDLEDNTVTQIIGTNGMGKSSIPLIIEEVLYNKNSKGIKKADIPNRYINNGYSIELSFEKDGSEYYIGVDRKSNIKVKLEKDGEDISSHTATNTYKSIQEVIGIDFKTFSQLVYQNTNASLQFLTATDTNRKKFLIDLLHLDNYVNLFEVFKEAAKESNSKIVEVNSEIATIEKWLQNNKLDSTIVLPLLDFEIDTEEDEKTFRSLSVELENISGKNKKILENNKYKELLAAINIEEVQNSSIQQKESYDEYQKEIGNLDAGMRAATKLLEKLENLGDVCPTCEQQVDSEFKHSLIENETLSLTSMGVKKRTNEKIVEKIKKDNKEFDRLVSLQREWEELFRSIDNNLPTQPLDKNKLEDRLAAVTSQLKEAKLEIDRVSRENEARTRANTRIEIIQAQTDGFLDNLKKAQQVLEQQRELDSNLDVLKKAFSTNGLLAYKIENLVKELEELANTYLAELSDGRFTLQFIVSMIN